MYETEYKDILNKQSKGESTIYIDTSWFRQFYTTVDQSKLTSILKYPRANQIQLVKLIMYIELATLMCTILISIISFRLLSILLAPVIFIAWGVIKGNASRGRQELHLTVSAVVLLLAFIVAVVFQISLAMKLFFIAVGILFFVTHFLYFYTAYITFNAIHNSVEFYSFCIKLNQNSIWTVSVGSKS